MPDSVKTLICIDNAPETLAACQALAAKAGLGCRAFSSEAAAIACLERQPAGLVLIIGQTLAEGDPLQVIEYCRASPDHVGTPIAFILTERDVDLARSAMDAGATEVFLRGEDEELHEFVREYAQSPHSLPTYSGKALLVEDDAAQADYVTSLCASLGFEVHCVDQAEAALDALREGAYHLLITDVVLRGTKTGIALIRQLRHELGLHIPVIVMSGFDDLPRRLLALRNGVGDFIAKPFAPEEFIWRVQRVMQLLALSEPAAQAGIATEAGSPRHENLHMLSPREYEICLEVLKGKSDKAIATDLGISYWTVRSHVQQIFAKTGAINRRELMARHILPQ